MAGAEDTVEVGELASVADPAGADVRVEADDPVGAEESEVPCGAEGIAECPARSLALVSVLARALDLSGKKV
jgi:hypothetical protein